MPYNKVIYSNKKKYFQVKILKTFRKVHLIILQKNLSIFEKFSGKYVYFFLLKIGNRLPNFIQEMALEHLAITRKWRTLVPIIST